MYDKFFFYEEHSALMAFRSLDEYRIEKWSYCGGWCPVERGKPQPCIARLDFEFVILRIADHPEGTNRHCIGLKQLVDVLNTTLAGWGLRQPMALLPDDLCPPDSSSYLDLPRRCMKCKWVSLLRDPQPDVYADENWECPEGHGCKAD